MSIRRKQEGFLTIKTEGGLLPEEFLKRLSAGDASIDGSDPESYHLDRGERIRERVNRSWNRLVGKWATFREATDNLANGDAGTTPTREKWLLPLFEELGYGRLMTSGGMTAEDKSYAISHCWHRVPVHLVGRNIEIDRRSAKVAGAAKTPPHGLLQEFLNRSDRHLWGFVSNGLKLRILRDNAALTRQAYIEFDLEGMMEGEQFAGFVVLWILCHQSRVEGEQPNRFWLERWSEISREEGVRALDGLRAGVEKAIEALGRGFLAHRGNSELKALLRSGDIDKQDYFRQLLRLVYRLIFLFSAEDRGLLTEPGAPAEARQRYDEFYSTRRIRNLAGAMKGTRHHDLWAGLRLTMEKLGSDEGCNELGLPALGSFLWSEDAISDLHDADLPNSYLLDAVRRLIFVRDGKVVRGVSYRNIGSEELGSIYESLLELHPELDAVTARFDLSSAAGHERKTTGSYYTPTCLINSLLDTALKPVVDQKLKDAEKEFRQSGREQVSLAEMKEKALLSIRVCDPACGSGHFLVAAAHRLAKELAKARSGDSEPTPESVNTALRDVIGHCIYGVDINPMSVELAKVSLWMEALEPGRPLSFLDHRIQCGNSLLGTTPALMENGIPDGAFSPIEGDDRAVCTELKRWNREKRQQMSFSFAPRDTQAVRNLANAMEKIRGFMDSDIGEVHRLEKGYREVLESKAHKIARTAANAWCAAFVSEKTREGQNICITNENFPAIRSGPEHTAPELQAEIDRLATEYGFFHWHIRFPEVFSIPPEGREAENPYTGWDGGFDCVLGNPPWERIKIQEKEWFAERNPDIATAMNAAERGRRIERLKQDDPKLHADFLKDCRIAEGNSHLIRNSGRYPLCGRGDVNTYTVFTELKRTVAAELGRVGVIIPSGIATDDTTKFFFQDIVEKGSLVSLFDFENRKKIFNGIDSRIKFCLLTLAGAGRPKGQAAQFCFFALGMEDLEDREKRFTLSPEDIGLINPNTRTCPIFRTRTDAELTKHVYNRVPVLIDENRGKEGNPWGIKFLRMLDMSNDSHLFRTREELEALGARLEANSFVVGGGGQAAGSKEGGRYLPLYEAKMIHHYNHRFGDYADLPEGSASTQLPDVPLERMQDPGYAPLPRYWVDEKEVAARLEGRWDKKWLMGWRDITNTTNERTVIFSMFSLVGVGHTSPLMMLSNPSDSWQIYTNLSSFSLDYTARMKVGGTHLTYGFLKQLPVLPPETYDRPCPWEPKRTLADWIMPRVLELTYTAWDLEPFAQDCGYEGPPFVWDDERRFHIRCELDAAYFHLYLGAPAEWRDKGSRELLAAFPTPREAVDYIMGTFPIVERKDRAKYGEYRTRDTILEYYDRMGEAGAVPAPREGAAGDGCAREQSPEEDQNAAEGGDGIHRP